MTTELTCESSDHLGVRAQVLVLGLGNDILRDDAVGLHVVRAVAECCAGDARVTVQECCDMGLSLLDHLVGYERVVIVDALQTGRVPAGHMHAFEGTELKTLRRASPHFIGVGEVLALGRQLGFEMPEQVRIFAVEVEDPFTLDITMTSAVTASVPKVAACVHQQIALWLDPPAP